MGESPKAEISVNSSELEAFSVETPGGRIHIRWDYEASATPNAQLAFFAEFMATAGVYQARVASCPPTYSSGNASRKRDVLGTWFLSILAGHHRYAYASLIYSNCAKPAVSRSCCGVSLYARTGPRPARATKAGAPLKIP